jgi:hypothetical protein
MRLLTGLGWPLIYVTAAVAYRMREHRPLRRIALDPEQAVEVQAACLAAPLRMQEVGLDHDLKERERELIMATLRVTGGSRKLTAERLGISPRTLRHKLQQIKAADKDQLAVSEEGTRLRGGRSAHCGRTALGIRQPDEKLH